METCTNDPAKDLEQVIKFYEYLKAERDHLEMIVSETIHYLVKQIEVYEKKAERDHLEMIVSETIHYLVKQIEVYENEDFETI